MMWTQEMLRAEDKYHREQLHRMASRRRRFDPVDEACAAGRSHVGFVHRVLHRGGRPRPANTTG